jgi:hypothetical protein
MGFETIVAAQVKDGLYCHRFSNGHVFFLKIVKVFECLREEMNEFFSSMCQHDARNKRR